MKRGARGTEHGARTHDSSCESVEFVGKYLEERDESYVKGSYFLHLLKFQASDDWLVNREHTENANTILCHACWGENG